MNNDEKTSWLAGLLTGWGIKAIWAKVIAGAVIGALAALYAATSTSCAVWRTWDELTPQQQQALELADRHYHAWRGDTATAVTTATGDK